MTGISKKSYIISLNQNGRVFQKNPELLPLDVKNSSNILGHFMKLISLDFQLQSSIGRVDLEN
jgi:hypothetical protein